MILDANGPDFVVSDEVDENGVVEFALHNSTGVLVYGALTATQAELLARHLNKILNDKRQKDAGMFWRVDGWHSHWCPEPLDEKCFWSGDPYASHGVGF